VQRIIHGILIGSHVREINSNGCSHSLHW